MKNFTQLRRDPLLLFWIGVITGALLISILFLYRLYSQGAPANVFYPTYPSYQLEKESLEKSTTTSTDPGIGKVSTDPGIGYELETDPGIGYY